MSKLFLVRHGSIKLNDSRRFWGKTDIELSDKGMQQAKAMRDRLAEHKIDAVYTSTLKRTCATAETIAAKHNLVITTCPELNELNFGYVEGLTFDEINQRYPELAVVLNDWNSRPKFPGGESFDELNTRVQKFLARLKAHQPEEKILIVAHAGPIRLIICNLLGITMEHWRQLQIDFASLSIIDTYPRGAILSLLNDVSHLKS